jgi:hypothetical protein
MAALLADHPAILERIVAIGFRLLVVMILGRVRSAERAAAIFTARLASIVLAMLVAGLLRSL